MNQIKKDQSMIELTMSDDPNLTVNFLSYRELIFTVFPNDNSYPGLRA